MLPFHVLKVENPKLQSQRLLDTGSLLKMQQGGPEASSGSFNGLGMHVEASNERDLCTRNLVGKQHLP